MRVIVVGPGALGCLFAAKLSGKNAVWLLDHDAGRAQRLMRDGLCLVEEGRQRSCAIRATADPELPGAAELALLCVKSHQVEEAVLAAAPALCQAELVLALANGIGHLEIFAELCRGRCWGVGVTAQAATLAGTGRVIHRGEGLTKIGFLAGKNAVEMAEPSSHRLLLAAAATLTQAGLSTEAVDEIIPHLWGKLLVNVGINALTAIHDCPNGALLESPQLLEKLTAAVQEAALLAGRLGIELPGDPVARTQEVCRATSGNFSSMLQDVRAGRRTEIAAINGAVVRLANGLGVAVPVNEELLRQVREIERNYRVFS